MPDPRSGKSIVGPRTGATVKELLCVIVLQLVARPPGGSMAGLMGTSSGRTWATRCTSQDCCCQNPCPRSSPLPTQVSAETLKHSPAGLAQSPVEVTAPFPWVLVHTSFCLCLQESLVGTGFDFNMTVPVLPSCLDFSFVLGHEEPFLFWWVTWLFSSCVLPGEDEHMPFYSAVLI